MVDREEKGMQKYSAAEVDLVLEWIDKYFEVNALINKVFGSKNSKTYSSTPSFENEIDYQRLRFWFRKNHDKFVPIWVDFWLSHGKSIKFTNNGNEVEYRNNPFLFYYEPDNLLDLVDSTEAAIPVDSQNTNQPVVELVLNIINSFSCTVIHLAYWIGEFAETSVQFP
jgi:hypothetical protein